MLCKLCGKPLIGDKCLCCGHKQERHDLNIELKDSNDNVGGERTSSECSEMNQPLDKSVLDSNSLNVNAVESSGKSSGTNQLALTGFILSICSIFAFVTAIPALVINIIALRQENEQNGKDRSKVIAGLVISIIITLFFIAAIIYRIIIRIRYA